MKSFNTLPEGYGEIYSVNLQNDKKLMLIVNGIAIAIAMIMALGMSFFVSFYTLFEGDDSVLKFVVLALGYIAYIILHEAVHGIAMKICGTKKIKYGFTGLYAFAGSDDYYNKKAYVFIALAPVVLWGVVLLAAQILVPADWVWVVYFIQIGNISGAAGDYFVTFKFLKFPKDILVRDYGTSMTVYLKNK